MSRSYYTPSSAAFQYTATGDSSSGGGSGSGMECLQLRSPPAPFHYLISEQAKSLVALQELQNEVGALLEFRDLVIETFPNLRCKLASGPGSGAGGAGAGGERPARRDWEPGVRVRRKLPARDDAAKPPAKPDSHSAVQDSGFSTETSSSKEAHSAAPPPRRAAAYEGELWQLLDVIQHRGGRLREEAEALRGALGERRALSLDGGESDPAEDFRRALAAGSSRELAALRRERDSLLDRLAEVEAEALAGRAEAERLRAERAAVTPAAFRLDERPEFRARPSAPGPARSPVQARRSVFAPVTPASPVDAGSPRGTPVRPRRLVVPAFGGSGESADSADSDGDLGKLDRIMNTPVRSCKVKTPDSRKISAILKENNPVELQRHLLVFTVHNQILQGKLDKVDRSKGSLVERLHRTREENDDLRFQLDEKTIELEGTRALVRQLEGGGRREGGGEGPRSMRALRPLPLHLRREGPEAEAEAEPEPEPPELDPEHERISDTPRKRPSKIPLPPSKLPPGLAPKPPTGRSRDTPSYRSRSGDSLNRPGSAQSWRTGGTGGSGTAATSLSSKPASSSISSSRSPGGRNSSFVAVPRGKDSLTRGLAKQSRDSLTGKVRNNDSLSRIRDSPAALSKSAKKEANGSLGKKSSVPVRRASSGAGARLDDPKLPSDRVLINPWIRSSPPAASPRYRDYLSSERETPTIDSDMSEPRILQDFITRSDQLAKDKRLQYLSSNLYRSKYENEESKERINLAYESPNKMIYERSAGSPNCFVTGDLTTMDVSTLHNSPTKSDVYFFNETFPRSFTSVWSRRPHTFLDSISNSALLNSNYSSNLQSVTNDSTKREGLAECDSLERKISFDIS